MLWMEFLSCVQRKSIKCHFDVDKKSTACSMQQRTLKLLIELLPMVNKSGLHARRPHYTSILIGPSTRRDEHFSLFIFNWIAANDDDDARSSSSSSFLLFHWVHTTAAATALRHQHKNHRIAPSFISLRKERRSSSSSMVVEKNEDEKKTHDEK